ncbi:GNAT family N-acetyltransferase [Flavobacterium sp. Fl-318]|uniref:GNAT family N-acetyltransferase n=1 Tax=Flavobacterium cupriresistens TaxID=2893885 RepID=A0ABU4R8B2_9FLAO|nr:MULTISPECIES: GNAT family N-acetyltransferase [unclassified Flavobacterium]MDX6187735.1 GNAT family N-acetyltransferase [Flavobacterium sp. Fl-318]UFH42342.1 GNAT family N-acetyltransferase [Flavobacterium sp. F-323]
MNLKIEILSKEHKRKEFKCGKELLDDYFHKQAGQDAQKLLSVCHVLTDKDADATKVLGYYTLSSSSILLDDFPAELTKRVPKTYSIPIALLGRIAMDKREQGKGLGEILLFDALKKCVVHSKTLAIRAVVVDPLDQDAIDFYNGYGFILIPSTGKMFLPIETIKSLIPDEESEDTEK